MGLAMEACAEEGKEFMVLDRPNPISGNKIEGNLTEHDCISFVSQFPIPYLYGLTPGELATYLNEEGLIGKGKKVKLSVIPMEGYTRDMDFRSTGMPWVLPSPHMPTPRVGDILSRVGYSRRAVCHVDRRGLHRAFQTFAAEWIKAPELTKRLNDRNIPGVKFRPIYIKPFYSTGQGKNYQGVEAYVFDPEAAPLSMVQFYVMEELADMYPRSQTLRHSRQESNSMFDKVCGSKEIRKRFTERYKAADIEEYWNKDAENFRAASAKYHLYK